MRHADELRRLLLQDAIRMEALTTVAALGAEDCWLGAGLVRDAVWDHLHHLPRNCPLAMWMWSGSMPVKAMKTLIMVWNSACG